jgi:hypothetical protein
MVAVGEVEAQGLEQVGVGIRIGDDGGLGPLWASCPSGSYWAMGGF